MRPLIACLPLLIGFSFPATVLAQAAAPEEVADSETEPPPAAVETPTSEPPKPAPAEPPPAPPASAAPARSGIACVVGQHPSEWPDSARTATELVCEALRSRGIPVGAASPDPGNAASAYVVHLDQLGSAFFLRVVHEDPVGTPRASKKASLYELSEAEIAAPRLAEAITTGKPVEGTQEFDSIVGSESRKPKKKKGEFVVGGGLAGLSVPGADAYMGPALHLFGFYETPTIGIGLQLHVGDASTRRDEDADFTSFSVGARYFFNEDDVSPFLGGGLAMSQISLSEDDDDYRRMEGSGLAAFAEVGLELFRLHSTHLIASLRVDAPFYTISETDDYYYGATSEPPSSNDEYHVPVTLSVGVGF